MTLLPSIYIQLIRFHQIAELVGAFNRTVISLVNGSEHAIFVQANDTLLHDTSVGRPSLFNASCGGQFSKAPAGQFADAADETQHTKG